MEKKLICNAALIVIGNEILSGRTVDQNINWLAIELAEIGIYLDEVRVIADDRDKIISTVNEFKFRYKYIFTTGGIGPTHDDITIESIGLALNKKLILTDEVKQVFIDHYKERLNDNRLKMGYLPEGGVNIKTNNTATAGFKIDNIYVFAGIPKIMREAFNSIKHELKGGQLIISNSLTIYKLEGDIAEKLSAIQDEFPEVEIGSYPFYDDDVSKNGVNIVLRSCDQNKLDLAINKLKSNI